MGEFIEFLSDDANKSLDVAHSKLMKILESMEEIGEKSKMVFSPSSKGNAIDDLNKAYAEQTKQLSALQTQLVKQNNIQKENIKTAKELERQSLKESTSRQALNKQRETSLKALEKEQIALNNAANVYNKVQAKINGMIPTYNNLQAKQQLGIRLTAKEEAQLTLLTNRLNKYQDVLKSTDATIGKHGREVGNYTKATSNLSASIGQISRELPNFGQSFSIGILSLTNNIGQLQDGIKQVKAQNELLKSQGKETQSVMSQIGKSIFTLNTALFIGIGIFSAYSKEIGDFVGNLFLGEKELNNFKDTLESLNKLRIEGNVNARQEFEDYKRYKAIATDQNSTLEEKKVAYEKLRSLSDWYLKNLSDQELSSVKLTKREKEYLEAKKKTFAFETEKKSSDNALKQIETINDEIKKRITYQDRLVSLEKDLKRQKEEYNTAAKKGGNEFKTSLDAANKTYIARERLIKQEKIRIESVEDELIRGASTMSLIKEKTKLEDLYNNSLKTQEQIEKETILLKYKENKDKQIKKIKDLTIANVDLKKSEFELLLLKKELTAQGQEEVFNDEKQTYDRRIAALKGFEATNIEIEQLKFNELKRLQEESNASNIAQEREKYNDFIAQDGVTKKQRVEALKDLNRFIENETAKGFIDRELLELQHSANLVKITKDTQDKIEDIITNRQRRNSIINAFNEQELNDEREHLKRIQNLTSQSSLKTFEAIEQLRIDNASKLRKDLLQFEIKSKSEELEKLGNLETEYTQKLKAELISLNKQYNNQLLQDDQKRVEESKKLQENYQSFLKNGISKGFSDLGFSSLNFFTDLDKNGKSSFTNLLETANDGIGKIAVLTKGFGDLSKDIYSQMSESSQMFYESEIERITRDRDEGIRLAGESKEAKLRIEKQYEKQRIEIERKRAKREKELALFNAIINTAQAVTSALARYDYFSAILFATLGGLQVANIQKQPIPEFYKGTQNAPEGIAKTDEKGAELHTDRFGRIKDLGSDKGTRLKYLEKGDKIYTAEQTKQIMHDKQLNSILNSNGINPIVVNNNNGLSKGDYLKGVQEITNTINSKEGFQLNIDHNGISKFKKQNGQRQQILNNHLNTVISYV